MDDHKKNKPLLDPVFEDLLRTAFPGTSIPPMRGQFTGKPERVRFPDLVFSDDPLKPVVNTTSKDMFEDIQKMMRDIQLRIGKAVPLNRFEERLYEMAINMGYTPLSDRFFGLHVRNKTLLIDREEKCPANRLLAISHELGHAVRFQDNKSDPDLAVKWSKRTGADPVLARAVMREEIMAWRIGAQILRQIGVKFNSPKFVRANRLAVLATYRMTTKVRGPLMSRLQLKED